MKKRFLAVALTVAMGASLLAGCGSKAEETTAAAAEAATTYGRLGVKVWICRGEIIPTKQVKGE